MTASSGVVDEIEANAVATKISETARATPMMALASGNHAIANDRNVTISTNRAISTPTASMIEIVGTDCENRSPPTATCEPAGSDSSRSVPMSFRAVFVSGETSVA